MSQTLEHWPCPELRHSDAQALPSLQAAAAQQKRVPMSACLSTVRCLILDARNALWTRNIRLWSNRLPVAQVSGNTKQLSHEYSKCFSSYNRSLHWFRCSTAYHSSACWRQFNCSSRTKAHSSTTVSRQSRKSRPTASKARRPRVFSGHDPTSVWSVCSLRLGKGFARSLVLYI